MDHVLSDSDRNLNRNDAYSDTAITQRTSESIKQDREPHDGAQAVLISILRNN